jgi:hypothetical protein
MPIPNYRLRPTGQTVAKFAERPAGPKVLKAWFYPGNPGDIIVPPSRG